ncbi:MAG: pyruvate kinase [Candidatus Kaiserbacteria bacterium]|nr:pyruvate kinase [Candidatus Kaiserbacteria bacterium]
MNTPLHTKTKIVATLGPNSSEVGMIERMLNNGLHVARINMSHGDHAEHALKIKNARKASEKSMLALAILQDLAGPKIRIGDFNTEEVTLVSGKKLVLTTEKCVGTVDRVSLNYVKLPQEVSKGMTIYLNDGKQSLMVDLVTETEIHTTIIAGGTIRGRRGVNVPDANLSISSLTPKDKKDLIFGIEQKVDFITLSFVRTADDIHLLRKLISKATTRSIGIVAKIETKSAIEHLEAIIEASDIIMVARGDLAIEMPLEKVPLLQKRIISLANKAGKPVITATQMLDSMRVAVTPTRAEVTDIANAILDGTDAIMLSDETAVGLHPDKTVEIMAKVAYEVETDPYFIERQNQWDFAPTSVCDAVGQSIAKSVLATGAKAVIAFSESGYTGCMVARYKPRVPIFVLTPHKDTFNKMLVVYGCYPILLSKNAKGLPEAQALARKVLLGNGIAEKGDTFVLGAGMPFGTPGSTNMMIVEQI